MWRGTSDKSVSVRPCKLLKRHLAFLNSGSTLDLTKLIFSQTSQHLSLQTKTQLIWGTGGRFTTCDLRSWSLYKIDHRLIWMKWHSGQYWPDALQVNRNWNRNAPSHQIKMPITRVVPDLKIAYIITIRFVLILERRPFISKVIY